MTATATPDVRDLRKMGREALWEAQATLQLLNDWLTELGTWALSADEFHRIAFALKSARERLDQAVPIIQEHGV